MNPEALISAWAQALVHQFPDWPGRSMIDAQTDEAFSGCLIFQKQEDIGEQGERSYFQAFTLTDANLTDTGSQKELFLRVVSAHEAWFESLLHLRHDLAGEEIVPGMMVRFNAPIAPDTGLNAWVIGFDGWKLDLGEGRGVEYVPVHPIYANEIPLLSKIGFAKFAERLGDELHNPYRAEVTS